MRACLRWGPAAALATLLLGGCGDGAFTPFDDFFGGGTAPGSSIDTTVPGAVAGVVYRRADARIIVLAPEAAPPAGATPLAGATVSLVELARTVQTGASGAYLFENVPPALAYTLRIALPVSLGGAAEEFRIRVAPGETTGGLPTGD